ncbi:hypothetical protein D3C80_1489670 [compost metagenome]
MAPLHHALQLILGGHPVLVELAVVVEGGEIGGVEHIAYLPAAQILVGFQGGHRRRLAVEGWPALVIGRLQVIDEGRPLRGVGQPYHQVRLTCLHLLECPSPGHPLEGERYAAASLQLAQNVDIQTMELVVLREHAKRGPDIGHHRQGWRSVCHSGNGRHTGKQQTKHSPACLAHPVSTFCCHILVG